MDEAQKSVNRLLEEWRGLYDEMEDATAATRKATQRIEEELEDAADPFRAKLSEVRGMQETLSAPFHEPLAALEEEIREVVAEVIGESFTAEGVKVGFRSGYLRYSYDHKAMTAIMMTLEDSHPGTAAAIRLAAKETAVKPKVTLARVKGEG